MARPIDEKLVVMKLDNSDFKKKAADTVGVFGKLTGALNKIPGVNLGKTVKDMDGLGRATRGINLNPLTAGIAAVERGWTAMGIVGASVLNNLTNRAVNAGMNITKSLTLDQVTAGFQEYELKIGAIGTMLSNTEWEGGNLESINKVLADLNEYADKTVYNFAQMTENIGRFTAAGVGMEDSATAIKGLSNLAAASGSDVNQLNTAMYQMSQSMAAGTFNLMDWNSLVNAGMGGKKTQDALLETAKAMGVNVDMSEGFRNSISDGWLSAEVFLATMKKFGEDESMTKAATAVRTFSAMMDSLQESIGSGWGATFELIFGDFEEATKFWTGMSESVTGFFQKSTDERNKLVKGIAEGGGFLNIFEGIGNAVKPVIQIFGAVGDAFKRVFPPKSVDQIVSMTESFKEFTAGMKFSESTLESITTIFQGAFSIFDSVFFVVKSLAGAFISMIPAGTGGKILGFVENIAEMAIEFNKALKEGEGFKKFVSGLTGVITALGGGFKVVLGWLGDFGRFLIDNVGGAVDWVVDKLRPFGQFLKDTFAGDFGGDELLGLGTLAGGVGIFVALKKKIDSVIDSVTGVFDGFDDIKDNISGTFESLQDTLQNFATGIKIANLVLIAGAVTMLAVALKTLEGIETVDLARGLGALAIALGIMMAGMVAIQKFNVLGGIKASITILAVATAVTIMAGALKKISDIDAESMGSGITGLVVIVGALAGAIIAISKFSGKIKVGSLQLLALATAVVILAEAVETMSTIDAGSLFKSIGALALIFGQLALFLKVVDGTKFGVSSALGLVIVTGAIHIMVGAIEKIADIDIPTLVKGLVSIGVILAQLAVFSVFAGGPTMILAGTGVAIIAGALHLLVGPITTLGAMSMTELAKGLGAMAVALAAVAAAGLLASGAIGGAVAITIMATALNLLLIPITAFAAMTWGELLMGIGGMALSLTALATAAILLTPAIPAMLGMSVAILAFSAAVLLAGVGIAAFGLGLATLATLSAVSIAAIVSALALLIQGLASLIPATVNFVVQLGLSLVNGLVTLIPSVVNAIFTLIGAILTAVDNNLPSIIEKGTSILVNLIDGMAAAIPQVLESVVKFMIAIIDGMSNTIREYGPTLVASVLELVGEIILLIVEAGVQTIDALFGWIPGVSGAMEGISESANEVIEENFRAQEIASEKGKDFADGLDGTKGDAKAAGAAVGDSAESGADSANLSPIGGGHGDDFAAALEAAAGDAKGAGKEIGEAGKEGADSINMSPVGADFTAGFASGIGSKISSVISAAGNIASAAADKVKGWLGIASPSRLMKKDGRWFTEGFAIGITDGVGMVIDGAASIATKAKDTLHDMMQGFELQPEDNELHFKAVVDYDKIDARNFGNLDGVVVPDTSITRGLVASAKATSRQNGDNSPRESVVKAGDTYNNQYDISVSANGIMSREERRRLAEDLQTEIKNIDDRERISRGEAVAF